MVTLEQRAYHEANDEERQAILDRMQRDEHGVIIWRELAASSPFSLGLMRDKLATYAADGIEIFLLVDLSDTARPDAPTRDALRALYKSIKPDHVAFVTGGNHMIRTSLRFVLRRMLGLSSLSVHETYEEAYDAVRAVQART